MLCLSVFNNAQKKKSAKVFPPPPKRSPVETVKIVKKIEQDSDTKKCFRYKTSTSDSITFKGFGGQLEYGYNSNLAMITLENYEYDIATKKRVEADNRLFGYPTQMQFINGRFSIENGYFIFTPNDLPKYEARKFKVFYKENSQQIEKLKDEDSIIWKWQECSIPPPSL